MGDEVRLMMEWGSCLESCEDGARLEMVPRLSRRVACSRNVLLPRTYLARDRTLQLLRKRSRIVKPSNTLYPESFIGAGCSQSPKHGIFA